MWLITIRTKYTYTPSFQLNSCTSSKAYKPVATVHEDRNRKHKYFIIAY